MLDGDDVESGIERARGERQRREIRHRVQAAVIPGCVAHCPALPLEQRPVRRAPREVLERRQERVDRPLLLRALVLLGARSRLCAERSPSEGLCEQAHGLEVGLTLAQEARDVGRTILLQPKEPVEHVHEGRGLPVLG